MVTIAPDPILQLSNSVLRMDQMEAMAQSFNIDKLTDYMYGTQSSPAYRYVDDREINFSDTSVLPDLSGSFGPGPKGYFNSGIMSDAEYEAFLTDLWVGILLTLMILSCVCCMCSCLLYHKFQEWKTSGKFNSQFFLLHSSILVPQPYFSA